MQYGGRKKETSIIHLCVAFIIGKRECCFFIIEKEKRQSQETSLLVFRATVSLEKENKRSVFPQVFSYSGSFLDLKKLLFFFPLALLLHMEMSSPKEYKTEIPYSYIDGDL
jgi:hypothetical protein